MHFRPRTTSRDRKDVPYYQEKRTNVTTLARMVYRKSNSPPARARPRSPPARARPRSPPHKIPFYRRDESVKSSTSVPYYKRSRSRSPHYQKSRSPYRKRSRSRSLERNKTLRLPYRKRPRSKSPYRRRDSKSPYRKRSASPRKARSPYRRSASSRSPYRRSFSISPPSKSRKSKSPLKKRFEAAVADLMPQLVKKSTISQVETSRTDGYAATATSFTMTAVHQVYNHRAPVPFHPVVPLPNLPYPGVNPFPPPIPYSCPRPNYNRTWVNPNVMPYSCEIAPPGVAPYSPLPPPQNPSFPAPVPVPHPMPSNHTFFPPPSFVPPPTLPVPPSFSNEIAPPGSDGPGVSPTSELQVTCATTSGTQLDLYSPSNSPPISPEKKLSPFSSRKPAVNNPKFRIDLNDLLKGPVGAVGQSTGSLVNKKPSSIILKLKKNLKTLSPSPLIDKDNNTPTSENPLEVATPPATACDINSSKSSAIPVVVHKMSFPLKEKKSNTFKSTSFNKAFDSSEVDDFSGPNPTTLTYTSESNSPSGSSAIPVASCKRTVSHKLKNLKDASNRILISTYNFPSVAKDAQTIGGSGADRSSTLTQAQILEQVTKLLSISKRSACTQVNFVNNSLEGCDTVFEVNSNVHENLLTNLTRLLK